MHFLGGMQDYNYIEHGTLSLTFEISCCKYPPAEDLEQIWEQNKKVIKIIFDLVLFGIADKNNKYK